MRKVNPLESKYRMLCCTILPDLYALCFFVYINEDILQQIHIGKNWCIKKFTKLQVKKCLMLEICKGRTPNKTYAMFSLHILFVGVQSHSFILNISHCIQFSINNWFILSSLLYLFFKPHDTFQVVFSF